MKNVLYALTLSVLLFACKQKEEPSATYVPRVITANERFNEFYEGKDSVFRIYAVEQYKGNSTEAKEKLYVKYKDTIVRIQVNKTDSSSATDKLAFAQFINTQKTALLVQIEDDSELPAPFYIIALKNNKPEVVSLYRPSTGKMDLRYTTGLNKIGRGGYLINNDFFVKNVNAQVYLIKRQNPEERIQGEFVLNSPDKSTLVFLTPKSFYQVHYPSDEVVNESLSRPASQSDADIADWIKNNFDWKKNKKGITFLRYADSDRIVDIKEFQ